MKCERHIYNERAYGRLTGVITAALFVVFTSYFVPSTRAQTPEAPPQLAADSEPDSVPFPIQVSLISDRGSRSPAVDVEIEIIGFRAGQPAAPMMRRKATEPSVLFKTKMKTNEVGIIKFPIKKALLPSFLRVQALHLGTTFRSEDIDLNVGAASLDLYTPTSSIDDLKADVVATLTVEEKYLQSETYIRFSTKGLKAVDLGVTGLPVGFLGLQMGDSVLDYLVTSDLFDHMQTRVHSGTVTMNRSPNGLRLGGVITPGKPALVRVAYPIPHLGSETLIAAKLATSLTSLQLDLRSPTRYIAELRIAQEGQKEIATEKGVVREHYEMVGSLAPHEIFSLRVSSLPVQNPRWRIILLWLCGLAAISMILLWGYFKKEETQRGKASG